MSRTRRKIPSWAKGRNDKSRSKSSNLTVEQEYRFGLVRMGSRDLDEEREWKEKLRKQNEELVKKEEIQDGTSV